MALEYHVYVSMEQKPKPRNGHTHVVNYFSTKVPRKSNGKNKKTLSIKTSY